MNQRQDQKVDHLRDAKQVLRILNREGFDAFIVGGAVRDHLLNMPISDVDITTSAKPEEVLKFFKGVPTGIKYGTVTINFREKQFEVTTFRSEEGYSDFRRPEVVNFELDVKEDVTRRDFTINGLLMDSQGDIIDLVDGINDLEKQTIRAIGEPQKRFNEDALRMLRAFYFQSKLGFKIDDETLKSIKDNRGLIKEVAAERVLEEMNKMLKGKFLLQSFNSIIATKVDEQLPGLSKGIHYLSETRQDPKPIIFYTLAFSLHKLIPSYWKFPNAYRYKLKQLTELVNKNKPLDNEDLYHYGLEQALIVNEVKRVLKRETQSNKTIEKMFDDLVIKSSLDLKFRAKDILDHTKRKAGAWVNNLINEIVKQVVNKKLANDFDSIKAFVMDNYERF